MMEDLTPFKGILRVDGVDSGSHSASTGRDRRVKGHRISNEKVCEFKFTEILTTGMTRTPFRSFTLLI